MPSISRIFLVATTVFAAFVSASPVAQVDVLAPANIVLPIETIIPSKLVYKGEDPGPLQVPATTASPTPSPRYTAPIKVVSDL